MESNTDSFTDLNSLLFDDISGFSHLITDDVNNFLCDTDLCTSSDESEISAGADLNTSKLIHPVLSYYNNDSVTTIANQSITKNQHDNEIQLEKGESNNDVSSIIRSSIEKSSQQSDTLSNSLVPLSPQLKQLKIIYPLENIYRARYKSDYFPQNGLVRRPRYIADNAGNHFITIQLPEIDDHNINNLYIRTALVTKDLQGLGRFYSPYKFQKNHNQLEVPDENPTYFQVNTSREDNFIMKFQLVLIKSKSDHLNYVQPLKPFTDEPISTIHVHEEAKLLPKDLISKYQLDQSQIAFTLCTQLPNESMKIHPQTTVYSTIITEASTSKKITESTSTSTAESTSDIRCPHCAHAIKTDDITKLQSTETKKSRVRRRQISTNRIPNKKKKQDA